METEHIQSGDLTNEMKTEWILYKSGPFNWAVNPWTKEILENLDLSKWLPLAHSANSIVLWNCVRGDHPSSVGLMSWKAFTLIASSLNPDNYRSAPTNRIIKYFMEVWPIGEIMDVIPFRRWASSEGLAVTPASLARIDRKRTEMDQRYAIFGGLARSLFQPSDLKEQKADILTILREKIDEVKKAVFDRSLVQEVPQKFLHWIVVGFAADSITQTKKVQFLSKFLAQSFFAQESVRTDQILKKRIMDPELSGVAGDYFEPWGIEYLRNPKGRSKKIKCRFLGIGSMDLDSKRHLQKQKDPPSISSISDLEVKEENNTETLTLPVSKVYTEYSGESLITHFAERGSYGVPSEFFKPTLENFPAIDAFQMDIEDEDHIRFYQLTVSTSHDVSSKFAQLVTDLTQTGATSFSFYFIVPTQEIMEHFHNSKSQYAGFPDGICRYVASLGVNDWVSARFEAIGAATPATLTLSPDPDVDFEDRSPQPQVSPTPEITVSVAESSRKRPGEELSYDPGKFHIGIGITGGPRTIFCGCIVKDGEQCCEEDSRQCRKKDQKCTAMCHEPPNGVTKEEAIYKCGNKHLDQQA